jgi:hypothetical protein
VARYSKELLAWTIYYTFQIIHEEFLVKSRGGTDSAGIRWKPLSPRTIAYRPLARGDAQLYNVRNFKSTKGLLTPTQDKRWRAIYGYQLRRGKTPAQAASIAWGIVKAAGAKTKIGTLSNREVPILILTRRLERSLRPGKVIQGQYIPSLEQEFEIDGNRLIVRTTVPYSDKLAEARPIFPKNLTPWITKARIMAKRKVGLR